jgi:SAM-dependent methyltransferase
VCPDPEPPGTRYDDIGAGYRRTRRPDPRVAAASEEGLGDAATVLHVGAGAGSYESAARQGLAIEPSWTMIRQRPAGAAPVIRAVAEALPFRPRSFDAALGVLTVHHWQDQPGGLREMARVARRRVVILTWDPAARDAFWLTRTYFPEILALDLPRFRPLPDLVAALAPDGGHVSVRAVPIPRDCVDGFLGAFWARPEAYLDPVVRGGISGFVQLPPSAVDAGLARLADDLASGRWERLFGELRGQAALDVGYRLLVAERPRSG